MRAARQVCGADDNRGLAASAARVVSLMQCLSVGPTSVIVNVMQPSLALSQLAIHYLTSLSMLMKFNTIRVSGIVNESECVQVLNTRLSF